MHGTMAYSLQFKDSKRQTAETVCLIHPILGGFTNCPCEHRPKASGVFLYVSDNIRQSQIRKKARQLLGN